MNTLVLVLLLSHGLVLCFGANIPQISNKLHKRALEESSYGQNGTNIEYDVGMPSIINGVMAERGDAPWQVELTLRKGSNVTYCGGILLSERVVVTAAHCIHGIADNDIRIGLGSLSYRNFPQRFTAHKSFIHEDFAGCTGTPLDCRNDIALIILNNDATLDTGANPLVQIANLPPYMDNSTYMGKDARISGWGITEEGKTTRPIKLRRAEVTVLDQEICSNVYQEPFNVYDERLMICAGWSNDNGASPCTMDSGGPLVNVAHDANELWGIISNGVGCDEYPFVYTRVTHYVDWIENKAEEGGHPITSDYVDWIKNKAQDGGYPITSRITDIFSIIIEVLAKSIAYVQTVQFLLEENL